MSRSGSMRVLGLGAVTPTGWGMPEGAVRGTVSRESLISKPEIQHTVARVVETGPLWDRWRREPRMRRVAPIARFMAEAVRQVLVQAPPARRGLIGCFSLGGIVFSRKFYEGMLRHGRALASPALFPETVYNSPLSHVAAVHGLDGPAYSLVGDESCWISACETAALWLEAGWVEEVVVVAGDELDSVELEGLATVGWFRKHPSWVVAEGAAALRLGPAKGSGPSLRVAMPALPHGKGFPSLKQRAEEMAAIIPPECRVLCSEQAPVVLQSRIVGERPRIEFTNALPGGGSFSVSPAWASLAIRNLLEPAGAAPVFQPVWGSDHALGALLWE